MNKRSKTQTARVDDDIDQDLDKHHQISKSWKDAVDIYSYIYANCGDPAFDIRLCVPCTYSGVRVWVNHQQDFILKLKDHLLGQLLNWDYEGDTYGNFTEDERNTICISGNQVYRCRTMQINYTTYDVRRDGDVINPQVSPDIMVNSPEIGLEAQPYWYARIIGIFHAYILTTHLDVPVGGRILRLMDFLWVCWFGMEPSPYRHRFYHACLPKIGFVELSDNYTFTFLDPAQVIRGAHIIPAFSNKCISALLPVTRSVACVLNPDEEDDWVNFYVNM